MRLMKYKFIIIYIFVFSLVHIFSTPFVAAGGVFSKEKCTHDFSLTFDLEYDANVTANALLKAALQINPKTIQGCGHSQPKSISELVEETKNYIKKHQVDKDPRLLDQILRELVLAINTHQWMLSLF